MAFSLTRWRPRHLFFAWIAYWVVLLATVVRAPLRSALAALSAPQGHGTMGLSANNDLLTLTVHADALSYAGSATFTSIAFWIAGPPLLLWFLWLATRTRPAPAHERVS